MRLLDACRCWRVHSSQRRDLQALAQRALRVVQRAGLQVDGDAPACRRAGRRQLAFWAAPTPTARCGSPRTTRCQPTLAPLGASSVVSAARLASLQPTAAPPRLLVESRAPAPPLSSRSESDYVLVTSDVSDFEVLPRRSGPHARAPMRTPSSPCSCRCAPLCGPTAPRRPRASVQVLPWHPMAPTSMTKSPA